MADVVVYVIGWPDVGATAVVVETDDGTVAAVADWPDTDEVTVAAEPIDNMWCGPDDTDNPVVAVTGMADDCRNTTGLVGGVGSPGNRLWSILSSAIGATVCPWVPSMK